MNRYLKQELKQAFSAPLPDPQETAHFLKTLPQPPIRMRQFLLIQTTYLRKQGLILSLLFLLPVLTGARQIEPDTLWAICALIPFLALLAVTESTRSTVYGMQEFELPTRFSLKSVMLARMSVLGLLDAFVLCCLIPVCAAGNKLSLLQTGLYLLVPYLLTVNSCLWITRRFYGREALYGCLCAAVVVSILSCAIRLIANFIYQLSYVQWWLLFAVFLLVKTGQEIKRTVTQTERYV